MKTLDFDKDSEGLTEYEVEFFDQKMAVMSGGEQKDIAARYRVVRVKAKNEELIPFALRAKGYNVEKITKIKPIK